MTRFVRWLVPVLILTAVTSSARSQSTWLGNSTTWSDANNWSTTSIPTSATATLFSDSIFGSIVDVGTGANTGIGDALSLTFTAPGASVANAHTFRNGILRIANGSGVGLIDNVANMTQIQTFQSTLTIDYSSAASLLVRNNGTSASRIQIDSAMTNGGVTMTVDGSQATTITGIIGGGSGGIIKNGAGTLTLGGANTFTGAVTINVGTIQLNNALGLGSTGGSTTIASGATLNLNGQSIGAEGLTMSGVGVGSNGALVNNSGTASSYAGTVAMAANSTVGGSGNITLSGVVSGGFALSKVGTNTLFLNAANTYTGTTTISVGTVQLGNALGLGTTAGGTIVSSGATLNLNGQTVGVEALTISGVGVGSAGALVNNSSTDASLSGTVAMAANSTIGGTGNTTLSGVVSGGFGLTKIGSGTLNLNGANSYTGTTTISSGTVSLGNALALGTTAGGTTVSAGAMLNLNGQTVGAEALSIAGTGVGAAGALINNSGTDASVSGTVAMTANSTIGGTGNTVLSGGISGAFNLTKIGAGTLSLTTTSSTYTGSTNVQVGTLALSTADNLLPTSTVVTVGSGTTSGTLVLGSGAVASNQTVAGLTTSGTGTTNAVVGGASVNSTLTINTAGTSTFNGTLGGAGANQNNLALTTTGSGVVVLGGTNTFLGDVNVQNGSLQLTSNAAIPTTNNVKLGSGANSGLLVLGSGASPVSISLPNVNQSGSGTANAVVGGATVNSTLTVPVSAGTTTFGTTLGGAGTNQNNIGLTKSGGGTLILNTANTYAGPTNINGGTLTLSNGSGSATGTSLVSVNSTATINGTGTGSSISINSGGTIAPGNGIGTINAQSGSTMTFAGGGTYNFEYGQNLVSNTGEGTTHDFINSAGSLIVTATNSNQFNLNLIYTGPDQAIPAPVTIRIAQFTGTAPTIDPTAINITGQFSATSVPVVSTDGNFLTLSFTPTPEPATILGVLAIGGLAVRRLRKRSS